MFNCHSIQPVSYTHLDVYKRQLTIMDVDFIHEVVVIDHQLLKSKEQGYYIETPKTKSGTRQVPLSRETIQAFQDVYKRQPSLFLK